MDNHKLIYRVLLYLIAGLVLTSVPLPFPLQAQDPEEHTPLINDALTRPPLPGEVMAQQAGGPPGHYQTSGYMAGRVAVGIILPESNGTVDPSSEDWTDSQIAEVKAEVEGALGWWTEMLPEAGLSFTYQLHTRVPTSYEPITHVLDEERLWISEVMGALGYEGLNHFERVYAYLNALRQAHEADWAFAIFVANSAVDDGLFADGRFAYAWRGGPFTVMTYDNDGYGITNMDAVLAHEMGHIFWALDQYGGARISCDTRSGYLDIPTYNSQYDGSCPLDVPSIMRGGSGPYAERAIDPYAQGQVGYWDTDEDGLPDPLDTMPSVTLVPASPDDEGQVSYTGTAEDAPWPCPGSEPHLPDATINTIADVEYRVDGGPWHSANPTDGQFDGFSEPFAFTIAPGEGSHTVETRAVNSVGNFSEIVSDTVFIDEEPVSTPTPEPPTPTPTRTSSPTAPPTLEPPTPTPSPTPSPTHTREPPAPTPTPMSSPTVPPTPEPPTPTPSPSHTPEPPAPTPTPRPTRDPNAGVEINDGAEYTNQITVTLQTYPPPEAIEMEVSNHPHFSPAVLLPPSSTTTWTLEQEGTGGLRTVYVRFKDGDGGYSASFEDSIVLDVRPPTGSISVSPQDKGKVLLELPAVDDLSGVQDMHLVIGEALQADNWVHYQRRCEVPDEGTVIFYVRYRDGAGNVSDPYRGINPTHLIHKVYIPQYHGVRSR